MNAPNLETSRLTLATPGPADAAEIAALANDFEVARWLTRMPHPYALEDAAYFLAEIATKEPVWIVRLKDRGAMIGIVGLQPIEGRPEMELGYWYGRAYWGRGFATEAARRVVAHAFEDLGLQAVIAGCFADNAGSARVLAKLGFVETGRGERQSLSIEAARPHVDMRLERAVFEDAQGEQA